MADKISVDRIDEMLRIVFKELKSVGGRARVKDLLAAAEPKLNLTDYEKERTRSGAVRWDTHVRFYTTDCVKAGFLIKTGGEWVLTQAGEKALKLPPGEFIRKAQREYRAWKKARDEEVDIVEPDEAEEQAERQAVYEQAKEAARTEIDEQIGKLGPYDFQKLVAELLKAMGYFVAHVAPPGPDGGVDVTAYKDPLGTVAPRIRVQVKHRDQKVTIKEVRELEALLRKEGDIGLFVSRSGLTADAEREIRSSTKHIETMDLDRLVNLWQQHYDKISEPGKGLLPLVKVHFLAPAEE
jgi:restriction system protein